MISVLVRSLAIGLTLSGLLTAEVHAQVFFVAPSGSDSNPGTHSQPFKTIKKGVSVLSPGATLYIKSGTYAESLQSPPDVVPSGTSWATPVTIAAYQGSRVIMRPDSGSNVIDLASSAHRYIVFDGLVLDAVNTVFSQSNWGNGIYIGAGASFIRVKNTEILNAPGNGILTGGGAQSNEFLNLAIHDNGRVDRLTHGVYLDSSNNLVEGCEMYNNAAYGIQVYGVNEPSNNVIRRNKIHDNTRLGTGGGVDISSGSANIAYNNIIWGHSTGAITVGWGNPSNSTIVNNTIFNTYGIYVHADSSGAVVQNNIVYGASARIDDEGSGTVLSNNLVTNPMFVDAGSLNFHLQASSPAIDAGAFIAMVPNDFDNVPRPQQSRYDIGAYEYSGTPPSVPRQFRVVP